MTHIHLSLRTRLYACWLILTNKEFYMEVVTSRYNNGKPLTIEVLSNSYSTETAIKKLQESLRVHLKMLRKEKEK